MIILFDNEKLAKEYNSASLLVKHQGSTRAKLIQRRLAQLSAAENLDVMRTLPGRCHELTGNLAGQFAIDLDGPYRLLFEPADEPMPRKPDGGYDWTGIKAIRILGVLNYHD